GTYPLPEAQLDRFMFNVVIDYPSKTEEHGILALTTGDSEPVIAPVATAADIEAMRHLVRDIPAASNVIDYALRIVRASRPAGGADDGVPAPGGPRGGAAAGAVAGEVGRGRARGARARARRDGARAARGPIRRSAGRRSSRGAAGAA